MSRVVALDPATYRRHRIHGEGRTWAETNCYSDIVIELLHGMGFEPCAALPFTLTTDFDVDQWTFFKFRHADIEALYALGIHELAPWRPLAEHVEEQVAAGRPVLVELDSFFLPDTVGTAYKIAHVKSTVAVNEIDLAQGRMGYFHNQSYYWLEGQDFRDIFQLDGLVHDRMLPPYIEFVKPLPRSQPLRGAALVDGSLALLRSHLRNVPPTNPFSTFSEKFQQDSEWLLSSDIAVFHAYSFATLRQFGACFELAATYFQWLGEQGVDHTEAPMRAFNEISTSTKTMQFQLARSMARKRPIDVSPLAIMGDRWAATMDELGRSFG